MGFFLSGYWMVFPFFGGCGGFTAEPRCAPVCAAVLVRGCSHVQPHCGICQIASIFFSPLSRKSAPLQGWKIMPDTTAHATQPRLVRSSEGAEKSPGMGGMGINPPSLQPGFLGMLRPPADPRASPTSVCSAAGLGVNFAGFSPPFCSPAQGLRKASLMGIFGAPAPVSLQARLVRLRIQVDAFGASSGAGVGAGHTHSTGLEESGGKGHPCFDAATSPGLCPFHPGTNPKRCCVHPHPRAAKFTSPLKLRCKWSPLAFLRSFLSRDLKFPG